VNNDTALREQSRIVKVWDVPVRLFHWAIVVLVFASWLTAHENWMEWHIRSGYSVFALVLFRLAWGFVGSQTARFTRFVRSPAAVLQHLKEFHHRVPDTEIGHNAAGGWMVLILLALLALQVASGLCANDQVLTEGPFAEAVGQDASDFLTHVHVVNFNLIEILVALHVCAVLAYAVVKRHNLVGAMITGTKQLPARLVPPRLASPLLAAIILTIAAGIVTFVGLYWAPT
jgi:cytochrome b